MENIIDIFKKIKQNLILLEDLMNKEFKNLLNSKTNIDKIKLITEKKAFILKKITFLKEKKMLFEKKNNISSPYLDNVELNELWKEIVSKCLFLKKKNLKYKIVLNKKFYLNQRFLNIYQMFQSSKKNTTYDIDGNVEN